MDQDDYSYIFKIIVIGDSSTGKTSLMRKYIDNKFEIIHDLTIGVEFRTKIEKIEYKGKEIVVKFHIWDTAGQESFRSIIKSYYRGVAGAIILFDVTDVSTHKLKFQTGASNTRPRVRGETSYNASYATFIRLGDT